MNDNSPRIQYDWARYTCPACGAAPDQRCRAKSGRTTDAHASRLDQPIIRRLQHQRERDLRRADEMYRSGVR